MKKLALSLSASTLFINLSFTVSKTVKDSSTGKVIRQITKRLGTIKITEADAQSSVAKIISGTRLKVGDIAKPIK